ncbi:2-methylthioadenine synthetase [Candidatus Woesearchaeota archaeon CG10_big_fil_rev_8_21_14_0_10_37_12]|nr:MAG: 2-methylthioadenine synthetase [Candidatus Woesearchaeota archaeon CG10_big_fil_rev_8_21_14_0_10_37_12]
MKFHVKSYGCSANHAESEIIAGKLCKEGQLVNEEDAELVVLNICTVKGDKTALTEIRKVKQKYPNKKIAITGCVTDSIVAPIKQIDPEVQLINTHHIDKIDELLRVKTDVLTKAKPVKLMLPRVRRNPVVGIVPISSGCLDACGFCSTRLVKGTLFSYPPEIIVNEVRKCVDDGCKQIWITGQDTCCYGFDRKTNLAVLLKKIVEGVPGDYKIRVGMGNPRHIPKYLHELIEVMKHPNIFKFLHIPVQAGNNEVLKAMRRGHTVETFKELVNAFRNELPEMTFSTDLIVGYPTETEEQFQDTLQLVKDFKPDSVNIARFAPRPGTSAATMEQQVHGNIAKERSRKLAKVFKENALEQNKNWIGWEGEVSVEDEAKDGMNCRNYAYKLIIVRENVKAGQEMLVKIIEAHDNWLIGERIPF